MEVPTTRKDFVLVIDDEPVVREIVSEYFEYAGIPVLTASNGEKGIAAYKQNEEKILLVLLDHMLPDMSGAETMATLKQLNSELPVVVVSGYDPADIKKEFGEWQPTAIVEKPFALAELLEQIKEILKIE